jgi:hypothetical protein
VLGRFNSVTANSVTAFAKFMKKWIKLIILLLRDPTET